MDTYESIAFMMILFLGVWMLDNLLNHLQQNDYDEHANRNNKELMDRMMRNKFFSDYPCKIGLSRTHYH